MAIEEKIKRNLLQSYAGTILNCPYRSVWTLLMHIKRFTLTPYGTVIDPNQLEHLL